jgi:hypothetical protein
MFKGNKKYYYILAIVFIGVIVLQYMQPKPINWSRTYLKKDKIPFGCYAIFHLLEDNYANKISVNQQTIYDINNQTTDSLNTLILVNDEIEISKLDLQSLFKFIKKGNTVCFASNQFHNAIKDTFKLDTQYNWGTTNSSVDSLLLKPSFEVKYIAPKNNFLKSYIYPQVATESYFSNFDTTLFKVSSINKQKNPVLIEANIGKGKLVISSLPDIFGNLFIVNHNNRYYTYTLLSKLKNNKIIWDEYYKTYNVKKKGIFQFIFGNDSLYMGYSILIIGLLVFMIFEMKRRQRSIPIIKPLQNSTLEFVDVISHVYFNSNNHKHIAEETIQYFYFYVRKKFNVNTNDMNDELYSIVSKLSGIDLGEVKKIFTYCQNLKHAPSLTQYDLLELNDRINNFKQKSIR